MQPPVPPPERPAAVRSTWEVAAGMLVGVLVCLGVPILAGALDTRFAVTPAVTAPFCLLAGVLLLLRERSRSWGRGLLVGLLLSLVIGAAATVLLFMAFGG